MGSTNQRGVLGQPRALTQREREILDFLLSVETPGVRELRRQARTAFARPWTCGCASIDITVDRKAAPASSLRTRPAIEAETKERSDPAATFDLLLWVDDEGWLSAVEIVDYVDKHGEDSPDEIPPPVDFESPRARRVE